MLLPFACRTFFAFFAKPQPFLFILVYSHRAYYFSLGTRPAFAFNLITHNEIPLRNFALDYDPTIVSNERCRLFCPLFALRQTLLVAIVASNLIAPLLVGCDPLAKWIFDPAGPLDRNGGDVIGPVVDVVYIL